MARIPTLDREHLSSQGQAAFDQIAGSRGNVAVNFKALLNSPEATARFAHLGAYLRFEGPVPNQLKEVAILAVARETDGHYVWTAHERLARKAGVRDKVIDAIRDRRVPQDAVPEAIAMVRYVWSLLRDHRVEEDLFREVQRYLGDQGMVDLTLLIGYYATMSLAISALDVEMEPGVASTLNP